MEDNPQRPTRPAHRDRVPRRSGDSFTDNRRPKRDERTTSEAADEDKGAADQKGGRTRLAFVTDFTSRYTLTRLLDAFYGTQDDNADLHNVDVMTDISMAPTAFTRYTVAPSAMSKSSK